IPTRRPSDLNPEFGPSVLSDAGDPASPIAPDVPINAAVASGLSPIVALKGTKIAARIGMVPKDGPIPIVTSNPTAIITRAASRWLSQSQVPADSTTSMTA